MRRLCLLHNDIADSSAQGAATKGHVIAPTLVLFICALGSGCTQPLEFADWTIPVPEGTRIIEYAPVGIEERSERVEVIEELVLGDRDDEPDLMFYQPDYVDVDANGNVYVLDSGEKHVKVFDRLGNYLRTLGGPGQGPGELGSPTGLVVLGDRVVVNDTSGSKFIHWGLNGSHIGDHGLRTPISARLWPSNTGRIVALRAKRIGDYVEYKTAVLLSAEGEELHEYAAAPNTEVTRADRLGKRLLGRTVRPSVATGQQGEVYFADGEEYQIRKFGPDNELDWALRVAWPRSPTPIEDIESSLEEIRQRRPEASLADHYWPERLPALLGIAADGHGHLWVFPYVYERREAEPASERPVDVYDAEGTLLFAGLIELPPLWLRSRGDHVYQIAPNRKGEDLVHVYRLVEPFGR